MSSQQDVMKMIFKELGISNHLQANYYNMLGKEILSYQRDEYEDVFPVIRGKNMTQEWNTAFSLAFSYINEKRMDLTTDITNRFVDAQVEDSDAIGKRLGCTREGYSTISNLVHDQRMVTTLSCFDLDYDLPPSYYAYPE